MPSVFIVILNYNGGDMLTICLNSVFRSDYSNLQLVVVDNNSEDGSFELAKKNFARAHFIKNPTNFGFAKGNNIGIRFALEKFADYILVLNNDTLIEASTISKLIQESTHNPSAGIISPLILSGDGNKNWFAGGKINWLNMRTAHINKIFSQQPYSSEYITGCAMLIRANVFEKIGLFDERFFLYYEDADFSLRAFKEGFSLLVAPQIKIKHFEQSSSNPAKLYWLVLSGLLFFKIHATFWQKIWMLFYLSARKIKNRVDLIFFNNFTAKEVHRAYQTFKKFK